MSEKIKVIETYVRPHPCPYKVEIHDDRETLCTCSEEKTRECSWEV